jgi:hypothetical protein
MPDLKVSATVIATNGPTIALNRSLTVDAFDEIEVTVESGTPKEVELQPGAAGKVQFITIVANWYGTDITYQTNVDQTWYPLDQPLILAGRGAIMLLGDPPNKLIIKNASTAPNAKDAIITILIGRNV